MDVQRDICTVEDLRKDLRKVLRDVRHNRRPVMVTSKGEPDVLIIPASLMKKQMTALKAACELAT